MTMPQWGTSTPQTWKSILCSIIKVTESSEGIGEGGLKFQPWS